MNRSDAPKKQSVPFGINGQRGDLLSKTPAGDNSASYDVGFPAVTMILKTAGGLPPKGQDMNQILFELSSIARWLSAGAINGYDADFSAAIGGYPMGSIVLGNDGSTRYMNTIESNTSDPNSDDNGWFNLTSGYLKTASNLSEIADGGSDAVSKAQKNIGLGDVALAGVCDGLLGESGSGYIRIPLVIGGAKVYFILQWGYTKLETQTTADVKLPISFPANGVACVACKGSSISSSAEYTVGAQLRTSTITITNSSSTASATQGIYWIALGY
ncbi:gp53-like domain-containing protein [Lonsdalea quercina]|uniref:gp53-like domain-containing protein n=1 Tax=Lonsdalea quercina TaxID=71657 RepID=UPI0039747A38